MKKNIIAALFILILSVSIGAGTTLSWFSSSTEPIVNEFTAGTVRINVQETQTPEIFMTENWNPGDCGEKEYTIVNTGSKSIYLRGKFTGAWYESDGETAWTPTPDEDVVSFGFLDDQQGINWTVVGDYYYYNVPIEGTYTQNNEESRTVTLRMSICLDGPKTGNQYAGKVFKLTANFEGVQSSNDSVNDVWPNNPYPVSPTIEHETSSAWIDGIAFNKGSATYFEYKKGAGSLHNPVTVDLLVRNTNAKVGSVSVWNTSSKIYYKVLTEEGYSIKLLHSYLGVAKPNKSNFEYFGFTYEPLEQVDEYIYTRDFVYWDARKDPDKRLTIGLDMLLNGRKIYISIIAEIEKN